MKKEINSKTLFELISDLRTCEDRGILFITGENKEKFVSYRSLWDNALTCLASFQNHGVQPGDQLILQLEDNEQFLYGFWGCILGGIIPVPLAVAKKGSGLQKLFMVWDNLTRPFLFTDTGFLQFLENLEDAAGQSTADLRLNSINSDDPVSTSASPLVHPPLPEDLAFIQYSSGSTGRPKGVTLTHRNLAYNIEDIVQALEIATTSSGLSWIPLTHDLGMIGFHLSHVAVGANQYILPTSLFIRRPTLWMSKASEHKAATLYSPNFGIKYYLNALRDEAKAGLDLSCVRSIVNGAEPISIKICNKLIETLAPCGLSPNCFQPSYGLAEASVGVSCTRVGEPLREYRLNRNQLGIGQQVHYLNAASENGAIGFVGVGQVFPHTEVLICDDEDIALPPNRVGHVQIKGQNVTAGYFNNAEANDGLFSKDGWLKTGDLGFVTESNELVITGRYKNLVIVNGQNYHAHDIEQALEHIEGIDLGKVAVCGLDGNGREEESVLVFVVYKKKVTGFIKFVEAVNETLSATFGTIAKHVIPVRRLPKTTSGKVRHFELLQRFRNNEFEEINEEISSLLRAVPQNEPANTWTDTERTLRGIWESTFNYSGIGRDDNFFALGGTSLQALRIVAQLQSEFKGAFEIEDLYLHPTIEELARVVEGKGRSSTLPIKLKPTTQKTIPLSFAQERMWFIDRLGGSTQYHISIAYEVQGSIDSELLQNSLRNIVDRHEVLRTVVEGDRGIPYQKIIPASGWSLDTWEMEHLLGDGSTVEDLIAGKIREPYSLSTDYMLRAHLFRRSEEQRILLLVLHHIAADALSIPVLLQELTEIYAAGRAGREPVLPELAVQYKDYAVWQREYLADPQLEEELRFWERKLENLTTLELPTDFARPLKQSTRGDTVGFWISPELSGKLKDFCRKQEVSVFAFLASVIQVLLHRYTGEKDITIGFPMANRNRLELEPLMGFFVNNLALRTEIHEELTFSELVKQVAANATEAFMHQNVPFEKVVDRVERERDLSRSPIFQVIFNLIPETVSREYEVGAATFSPMPLKLKTSKLDLAFNVEDTSKGFNITIDYCTDLFRKETISRLAGHFDTLVESAVNGPDIKAGILKMLRPGEEKQLLTGFNDTNRPYPTEKSMVGVFEEQVAKTPDNLAVAYGEVQLTYQALNQKANRLANYLQKNCNVQTNDLVGIMMDRSEWAIISILGILKAGGAYVPIDVNLPAERKDFMIRDTNLKALLIDSDQLLEVTDFGVQAIALDLQFEDFSQAEGFVSEVGPRDLAYVIYTSGSTGKPKGVLIEHTSNVNMALDQIERFSISETDRVLQFASLSFDASVYEIFMALYRGACIVIADGATIAESEKFPTYLRENNVSVVTLPPVYLNVLNLDELGFLRVIITAGEAAKVADAAYCASFADYYNAYGPTECAVCVSVYKVSSEDGDRGHIPIGKAISNTSLFVLDNNLNPVPPGVTGELYISGSGLARGYLNRPELTAERFLPNPFEPGTRMYRTGDLVKWLPDGNIEFRGRQDGQVKIRGHRIELGEIESVLQKHDDIQQAVVLVREDAGGNRSLVAYLITGEEYVQERMWEHLRNHLPKYMVPTFLVEMDAYPLTNSGKVDRKRLPDPIESNSMPDDQQALESDTEIALAEIWKSLLHIDKVAANDNFFELGGDSIISIQLVSRARELGYALRPRDVFEHPVLVDLAGVMEGQSAELFAEQGLLSGHSALLGIQQWFFEAASEHLAHYNQAILFNLQKNFGEEHLRQSLRILQHQHDALRFTYRKEESGWQQEYGDNYAELEVLDLAEVAPDDLAERITSECAQLQQQLSPQEGKVLKALLFRTPEQETNDRLFLVAHHLVIDAVSWRILIDQLLELMTAPTIEPDHAPRTKTCSYRQWTSAMTEYSQKERAVSQLNYWQRTLEAVKPLPVDFAVEHTCYESELVHTIKLDEARTKSLLQEVNHAYQTKVEDILLSALATTIGQWTDYESLVVARESHGREELFADLDTSRTVGWFTNLHPLRIDLTAGAGCADRIKSVKEQVRHVPDQGMSFSALRYLHPSDTIRNSLNSAPPELIFNYLGQLDNTFQRNDYLGFALEQTGGVIHPDFPRPAKIVLQAQIVGGNMELSWAYSSQQYEGTTIERLAGQFVREICRLIDHCQEQTRPSLTPSDFGLPAAVSYQDLDAFLEKLQESEKPAGDLHADGPVVEGINTLSPLQEGMLFHSMYDQSSKAYRVQIVTDIANEVDQNAFQFAWESILKKHSILRTGFFPDQLPIPVQVTFSSVKLPIKFLDYSTIADPEREQAVAQLIGKDFQEGFEFSVAPLMRLTLVKLSDAQYKMIWTYMHIILDGWSMPVIVQEFLENYERCVDGNLVSATQEDSYQDFIRYIQNKDEETSRKFWENYLSGVSSPSLLPFAKNNTQRNKQGSNVEKTVLTFTGSETTDILAFANETGITINTLVQGIWALLLSKYTDNPHPVFWSDGFGTSGRPGRGGAAGWTVYEFHSTVCRGIRRPEHQRVAVGIAGQPRAGQRTSVYATE